MMTMKMILDQSGEFEFPLTDFAVVIFVADVESLVNELQVADETVRVVESARAYLAEVSVGKLRRPQRRFHFVFRIVGGRNASPLLFFRSFFSALSGAVFYFNNSLRRRSSRIGDFLLFVKGVYVSLDLRVGLGKHLLAEDAGDERLFSFVPEAILPFFGVDHPTPMGNSRHGEIVVVFTGLLIERREHDLQGEVVVVVSPGS